jgi:class 3 adenylate cyclase
MAPLSEQALLAIYQGQQEHAWRKGAVEAVEGTQESAGLNSRLHRPPVVCFLDITGYTRLTEERGDEAADLPAWLGTLVRRSSQEHGGQPVKWLGDGVMFYFRDPGQSVLAVPDMVEGRGDPRPSASPSRDPRRTGGLPRGRLLRPDRQPRGEDRRVRQNPARCWSPRRSSTWPTKRR